MTFEEKVKFLRTLPRFKVAQESEIRGIAFSVKETEKPSHSQYVLSKLGSISLIIESEDVEKIVRVYPDLEAKFK